MRSGEPFVSEGRNLLCGGGPCGFWISDFTGGGRTKTGMEFRTLEGNTKAVDEKILDGLKARLSGPLLREGDAGYDEARLIWNATVAKKPAPIARCRDTADVVQCVNF